MATTATRKKRPAARAAAGTPAEKTKAVAGFTVSEVGALLKLARTYGVKTLKIGTLAVSFEESTPIVTGHGHEAPQPLLPQVHEPSADEARKATASGKMTERSELAAEELDRLQIEDPLAYEKHLMSEDATDAED